MTAAKDISRGVFDDLDAKESTTISRSQMVNRIENYLDCPYDNADFVLIFHIVFTTARLAYPDRVLPN